MPMPLPANAVEIGANAYLFPSPVAAGVTDCFIIAHGGTPPSKEYRFTVPAGCTVNFFASFGQAHVMPQGLGPVAGFKVISGQRQGAPPVIEPRDRFAGGASIRDFILGKAIGTHYEAEPDQHTYLGISRALNELAGDHAGLKWLPHYVSIRNRTSIFRDTNIWLSKVIEQIRAHDRTIVNFYCSHCRGYIPGASEAKYLKTVGSQGLQ